jgi:hypothetical protein
MIIWVLLLFRVSYFLETGLPKQKNAPKSQKLRDDSVSTAVPPVFASLKNPRAFAAVSGGSRIRSPGGLRAAIRRRARTKVRGSLKTGAVQTLLFPGSYRKYLLV